MGKRKLGGSDNEDSSDDDEENEKSIVLNNGNNSDTNKETEGSSGSVTGVKRDELSGGGSCESASEEEREKEILVHQISESGGCFSGDDVLHVENGIVEPENCGEILAQSTSILVSETAMVSATDAAQAEKQECSGEFASENVEEITGQPPNLLSSANEEGSKSRSLDSENSGSSDSKSAVNEETILANTNVGELERPLDFDEFNSAAEMEVGLLNLSFLLCFSVHH